MKRPHPRATVFEALARGTVQPELFAVTELHVLGKEAGRAICGALIAGAPENPIRKAWGSLAERTGALDGIERAIERTTLALPGNVSACKGCLTNVTRMRASDAAKAAGGRGAARTKARPAERAIEESREAEACPTDDDEEI